MAKDLDSHSGGGGRKWFDGLQRWEFPQKTDWCCVRLYGPVWSDFQHWVATKTGKQYPEFCHGYDVDNDRHYPDKEKRCEPCRLGIVGKYRYFSNLISLKAERDRPANPDPQWSPIYMIELAPTLLGHIQKLKPLNGGYSVTDIRHGALIQIKYDAKAKPAEMYSASMDTKDVPFTPAQLQYTLTQTDPFGETRVVSSENGRPAMYTYFRAVNSPDETRRSLKQHGYYEREETDSVQPTPYAAGRVAATALTEEPVGYMPKTETREPSREPSREPYREPPRNELPRSEPREPREPRNGEPRVEPPRKANGGRGAASAPDHLKPLVFPACTTAFGEFARAPECFSKCAARNQCREETDRRKQPAARPVADGVDDSV